jgi:hypothetical protein
MGIEGENRGGYAAFGGRCLGDFDEPLMAAVHAVEIADCRHCVP